MAATRPISSPSFIYLVFLFFYLFALPLLYSFRYNDKAILTSPAYRYRKLESIKTPVKPCCQQELYRRFYVLMNQMGISPLTDERATAYCMTSPSHLILTIPLLLPSHSLSVFLMQPSRYHSIRILSSLYRLSPAADFPILLQSKPLVSK